MSYKKAIEYFPIFLIFIGSVLFTFILHISGAFGYIEMKLYDFRFGLRGAISGVTLYQPTDLPLAEKFEDVNGNGVYDSGDIFNLEGTGNGCWEEEVCGNGKWDNEEEFNDTNKNDQYDRGETFVDLDECPDGMVCHEEICVESLECHDTNQNGIKDDALDVILVEIDDDSYENLNEASPYSRSVWARAVRNLTKAGAKVITIDIEFDKADHQIENLKSFLSIDNLDKIDFIDGDTDLANAIRFAKTKGTEVILASKIAFDKNREPSTYRVVPYEKIMTHDGTPHIAQVGITKDIDGIQRLYPIYHKVNINDENYYYSLAVSSVLRYKGIKADPLPTLDKENYIIDLGGIKIPIYGKQQYFLLNYYGPRSHSFKTFSKYPLVEVLDTEDYLIGDIASAYCLDSKESSASWGEVLPELTTKVECENRDSTKWTTSYDSDWMDMYINPSHQLYQIMKKKSPFEGKIVFIGTSLAEDHDFKDTPFLNYQGEVFPMPGVEVHANATQQILDNNYILYPWGKLTKESDYYFAHLSIIFIFTLVTLLIITKLEPFSGFLFIVTALFIWFSYSIGLFFNDYIWIIKMIYNSMASSSWAINMPGYHQSAIVPVIFPAASIIIPYGINLSYKLIVESSNKRFLKESFGAYISPDLIDQMFDDKQEPKLGGDLGYHTMMFSDIASFSTFSEKLEPESLLTLLNEYLTAMTNILIDNKGTLDKYIGDAIVAFYGAPIEIDDHEYLACKTALSMNRKLEDLRLKWKSEGEKWPEIVHDMQHRIGINAGKIVVGNMGSEMKLNYTMTGDQVNLTARLESSAKQLGITIQVGENIYEKVKDRFIFRDLGKVIVVGRNQSLNVYELMSNIDEIDDSTSTLLKLFHQGLEFYYKQDWENAIKYFKKSDKHEERYATRKTTPSQVFIKRSQEFKANPPPKDWDGTYALGSK